MASRAPHGRKDINALTLTASDRRASGLRGGKATALEGRLVSRSAPSSTMRQLLCPNPRRDDEQIAQGVLWRSQFWRSGNAAIDRVAGHAGFPGDSLPFLGVPWIAGVSAVRMTIRARQTCFCGLLRSRAVNSSRSRSLGVTVMEIQVRMPQIRTTGSQRESPTGSLLLG